MPGFLEVKKYFTIHYRLYTQAHVCRLNCPDAIYNRAARIQLLSPEILTLANLFRLCKGHADNEQFHTIEGIQGKEGGR